MHKLFNLLVTVLLFSTILQARENPFLSISTAQELPVSSNIKETFEPLKRASITFPDSARVLKEVIFKYQKLDGEIVEKKLLLNRSIDWHLPVFVSQTMSTSQNSPIKKEIIIIDRVVPAKVIKKKEKKVLKKANLIKFKKINFIKFSQLNNKSMQIITNDKILRYFLLTKPHRLVIDLKRNTSFVTKTKLVNKIPFKSITLGNHNGYYRVVVALDGQYKIKVEENDKGLLLNCK
ncbi:MAG: AMIN domain-containing protein [Helicobacteraceae bacterium]|nr:AMIN domain-containing protein [Helicobacteraceae bacterium]